MATDVTTSRSMPTPATSNVPLPKSEDEFEAIVVDALRLRLGNPYLVRFGRRGQRQQGIDGHDPSSAASSAVVWQSTLQEKGLVQKIRHDLNELDGDDGRRPHQFIVAIGRPRDADLQVELRNLSSERMGAGKCTVLPLFWDDILGDVFSDEGVARKHFPLLYPSGHSQSPFSHDDLLLLSALEERDAAEPEGWMSSFEAAVRTGLSRRDLNDAIEILTGSGHVSSHPFSAGQEGGSSMITPKPATNDHFKTGHHE